MILRICASFLIVLGIVSLAFHLESGVLLVIIAAGLLIVHDKQRKRKLSNG